MRKKTKGRERKTKQIGGGGTNDRASQAAWLCVYHHGLWCTPWAAHGGPAWSDSDASRTLRFGAFFVRKFLPWVIRIGPIGLLLLTSLIF